MQVLPGPRRFILQVEAEANVQKSTPCKAPIIAQSPPLLFLRLTELLTYEYKESNEAYLVALGHGEAAEKYQS